MELSQSTRHRSSVTDASVSGLTQAIRDAYHRLAFHEERLDLAAGRSAFLTMPVTQATLEIPFMAPVPVRAGPSQNPLHHLRQILDLMAQRTSDCEAQLHTWNNKSLPLKEVLALAQIVRRTQRQAERASIMLEQSTAELPAAWRSQARLYRRMLTHQRQRLNAVCTRVEDFSLMAQRLRQATPSVPHAVAVIRSSPRFFSKVRSWLTHPLVDVRIASPIE